MNAIDDADFGDLTVVPSYSLRARTPCGNLYIHAVLSERVTISINIASRHHCQTSFVNALVELINLALEHHTLPEVAAKLRGFSCGQAVPAAQNKGEAILSCSDVISTELLKIQKMMEDRDGDKSK